MRAARVFISHISEEARVVSRLKEALTRDFLGLLDVFISSDTEGIGAGDDWLKEIDKALRDSSLLIVLCSPESVRRPWVNFEAGAAWMREIPIIPVCHAGLTPRDLPMPLSTRQGLALGDPAGLRALYARIAKVLKCETPVSSFKAPAEVVANEPVGGSAARRELGDDRAMRKRLQEVLSSPRFKWRTLPAIAAAIGISEEVAGNLLRADDAVRFGRSKTGKIIVGLRSRVGDR